MANILPYKQRATLRKNYRLRVIIIASISFSVVIGIGVITLIPSYITVQTQQKEARTNAESQKQIHSSLQNTKNGEVTKQLTQTVNDILSTKSPMSTEGIRAIINEWVFFADTIAITSIFVNQNDVKDSKNDKKLNFRISGIAQNRTALNSFVQKLRKDSSFSNVTYPVADLASTKEIDFSITLAYKP